MATARRRPVDFARIRELIRPEQVLRSRGWLPLGRLAWELRGPCPFHGSRSPTSRVLAVSPTVVYCHKCHWTGDSVAIYAWMLSVDAVTAAYELCREFGIEVPLLP